MSDAHAPLSGIIRRRFAAMKPAPDSIVYDYSPNLNVQAVTGCLALQGIALVRGFIPRDEVARLQDSIATLLSRVRIHLDTEKTAEYDEFIVNFQLERFKKFPELVAEPKPVFNIRHGRSASAADAGFVDLFKPDALVPELASVRTALQMGLPKQILAGFPSLKYQAMSFNLYINESVTYTRDFHIDADIHHVKAFVYLTDVMALSDGPYCYVPASHQETQIKALNKLYNEETGRPWTDMSLVDPANAIACLAPAGTLIVSIQSGLHRGYPQIPNSRRLMLTQLFEPA